MAKEILRKRIRVRPDQEDLLVSRRYVAGRWEVTQMTVIRMEKAGHLVPLRIGGNVRYRLSDIERIEREAVSVAAPESGLAGRPRRYDDQEVGV